MFSVAHNDILALQWRSSLNRQREAATYCDPFGLTGRDGSKSWKKEKCRFQLGFISLLRICNWIQAPIVFHSWSDIAGSSIGVHCRLCVGLDVHSVSQKFQFSQQLTKWLNIYDQHFNSFAAWCQFIISGIWKIIVFGFCRLTLFWWESMSPKYLTYI